MRGLTFHLGLLVLALAAFAAGCGPSAGALVCAPPQPPKPRETLPPAEFVAVPETPDAASVSPRPTATHADHRLVPDVPGWRAGKPGKWTYIILHHSATDAGNAATFDRIHRQQRHWDELGYHFVVLNGNGGSSGKVEIGPRWVKQKHGAHCRVDPNDDNYWNEHGIGICLVGDFTDHRPSPTQLRSAARLVAFLMQECDIPADHVLGHGQVPGAQTECPGKMFPYADLLAMARRLVEQNR